MLARLRLISSILATAGSLALLSAAGSPADAEAQLTGGSHAGPPVSARTRLPAPASAAGKIRAKLSKTSFAAVEAGKVKLLYSFAPASKHFTYRLLAQTGGKWVKLREVARTGRFAGARTKTVKSIFGSKTVSAGRYRLELSADANRLRLGFKVLAGGTSWHEPDQTGEHGEADIHPPFHRSELAR